jgi:hypothetical protein
MPNDVRLTSLLALLLLAMVPAPVDAQQTQATSPDGWLVGGSLGMPGAGVEPFFPLVMVGVEATRLQPGSVGLDAALFTAPAALAFGLGNAAARIGLTVPVMSADHFIVIPTVGITAMGVASPEDQFGMAGAHAGLSAVMLNDGGRGVRVGMTWHRFIGADQSLWLFEIGMVKLRVTAQ